MLSWSNWKLSPNMKYLLVQADREKVYALLLLLSFVESNSIKSEAMAVLKLWQLLCAQLGNQVYTSNHSSK
jgi:hypothetical protein